MTDDELRELLWSEPVALHDDAVWESVNALGPRRRRRARMTVGITVIGAATATCAIALAAASTFHQTDGHRSKTLTASGSDCVSADIALRATPTFESSMSLIGEAKVLVSTTRPCVLPTASLETQDSRGGWVAVPSEPYAGPVRQWQSTAEIEPGGADAMYLVSWHFMASQFSSGTPLTCQGPPLRFRLAGSTVLLGDWCDSDSAALLGPFVADDATSSVSPG